MGLVQVSVIKVLGFGVWGFGTELSSLQGFGRVSGLRVSGFALGGTIMVAKLVSGAFGLSIIQALLSASSVRHSRIPKP